MAELPPATLADALSVWLAAEPQPRAWFSLEGQVLRCSAAFATLLGQEPEALVGRTQADIWGRLHVAPPPTAQNGWEAPASGLRRYLRRPLQNEAGQRTGWLDAVENTDVELEPLAHVGHEIRTPLTVLGGLSHALLFSRPALDPERERIVRSIWRNTAYLQELVANVLEAARLRAGESLRPRQKVDLAQVIREALDSVVALAPAGAVPASVELPSELSPLYSDPVAIRQILSNLLSNAAKYAPPGATKIVVREIDGGLLIDVHDEGPGLAADQAEAIFQPFTRLHPEATMAPSAGLGLTIARGCARRIGGTLTLDSELGHGAVFTLALPLVAGR